MTLSLPKNLDFVKRIWVLLLNVPMYRYFWSLMLINSFLLNDIVSSSLNKIRFWDDKKLKKNTVKKGNDLISAIYI